MYVCMYVYICKCIHFNKKIHKHMYACMYVCKCGSVAFVAFVGYVYLYNVYQISIRLLVDNVNDNVYVYCHFKRLMMDNKRYYRKRDVDACMYVNVVLLLLLLLLVMCVCTMRKYIHI